MVVNLYKCVIQRFLTQQVRGSQIRLYQVLLNPCWLVASLADNQQRATVLSPLSAADCCLMSMTAH